MTSSAAARTTKMDVAIVTHDLRTPLQAIMLGLQILRHHPLGTAQDELVTRIYNTTKRMGSLIDRILDRASLQLSTSALHREPVDLEELCREAVDEFRMAYPGRDFRVVAERGVRGSWDRLRLVELISNLLANAIEHGDRSAPVVLQVRAKAGAAHLEVANQGPVIPRELSKTIFEPFHRAPSAMHHKGVGLGLYIVAQIVAAHGGTISLSSGRARTRFMVTLPLGK